MIHSCHKTTTSWLVAALLVTDFTSAASMYAQSNTFQPLPAQGYSNNEPLYAPIGFGARRKKCQRKMQRPTDYSQSTMQPEADSATEDVSGNPASRFIDTQYEVARGTQVTPITEKPPIYKGEKYTETVIENWKECVPVPVCKPPRKEQPIILQNDGVVVSLDIKVSVDVKVSIESKRKQVTPVILTPVQQGITASQSAWIVNEEGNIVNKMVGGCLGRATNTTVLVQTERPSNVQLCGCGAKEALKFDVDYTKGFYKVQGSSEYLSISKTGQGLSLVHESHSSKTELQWGTYTMRLPKEAGSLKIIKEQPQPLIPFSLQFGDVFLIADLMAKSTVQQSNAFALRMVPTPSEIQLQNWAIQENGRLMNMIHKNCMGRIGQDNLLGLLPCEDSKAIAFEFSMEKGMIFEKGTTQCMKVRNDQPVLVEYKDVDAIAEKNTESNSGRNGESGDKDTKKVADNNKDTTKDAEKDKDIKKDLNKDKDIKKDAEKDTTEKKDTVKDKDAKKDTDTEKEKTTGQPVDKKLKKRADTPLPKGKNSTTTSTKEQWKFLQMIPM
jgi:hypothetical protein